MNKLIKILLIFILILILFPSYVVAHPGRTDSRGGHTCRTNCPDWGYSYGGYHYHNGGYTIDRDELESQVEELRRQREYEEAVEDRVLAEEDSKSDWSWLWWVIGGVFVLSVIGGLQKGDREEEY